MPAKADSPLLVDSDAVLALPIPLELFEVVGRGHPQSVQGFRHIQHSKLADGNLLDGRRKLARDVKPEELFSVLATESLNRTYYNNGVRDLCHALLSKKARESGRVRSGGAGCSNRRSCQGLGRAGRG